MSKNITDYVPRDKIASDLGPYQMSAYKENMNILKQLS